MEIYLPPPFETASALHPGADPVANLDEFHEVLTRWARIPGDDETVHPREVESLRLAPRVSGTCSAIARSAR